MKAKTKPRRLSQDGMSREQQQHLDALFTKLVDIHSDRMELAGFVEPRRRLEHLVYMWGDTEMSDFAKVNVALGELALMHTELSEAVEAVRKQDPATWGDHTRKDTLIREYAGAMLRIMDSAARLGIGHKLMLAVFNEMRDNSTRPHKHGGKAA